MTIDEANYAIDHGLVWCRMGSAKQWQARRNGATQTWKTRPGQFRIPVKMGLRTCYEFTHNNFTLTPDGKVIL